MVLTGGIVIRLGSLFPRIERAEVDLLSINMNVGYPFPAIACVNAFVSTGIIYVKATVPHVFGMRADAQVASAIVQTVAIEVINQQLVAAQTKDHSVHQYALAPSASARAAWHVVSCVYDAISAVARPSFERKPGQLRNQVVVLVVDECEISVPEVYLFHGLISIPLVRVCGQKNTPHLGIKNPARRGTRAGASRDVLPRMEEPIGKMVRGAPVVGSVSLTTPSTIGGPS